MKGGACDGLQPRPRNSRSVWRTGVSRPVYVDHSQNRHQYPGQPGCQEHPLRWSPPGATWLLHRFAKPAPWAWMPNRCYTSACQRQMSFMNKLQDAAGKWASARRTTSYQCFVTESALPAGRSVPAGRSGLGLASWGFGIAHTPTENFTAALPQTELPEFCFTCNVQHV